MYTVIRQYALPDPAVAEEITRRTAAGFAPLIRQAPGFVAWYLVQREREVVLDERAGNVMRPDPAGTVLLSVSVFETQTEAHRSSALAAEWIEEHLAGLLPERPILTGGAVVAHAAP